MAPTRCACSRELARQEGIFVGISAGATLAGALRGRAPRAAPARPSLCMLPDTGERYLSTPLFDDIPARHDRGGDGDFALDAALPLRCAAAPAPAPGRRSRRQPAVDPAAARFVTEMLRDQRAAGRDVRAGVVRVLLVGAQAVRALGIPYRSRRPRLRRLPERTTAAARSARALHARTGVDTIPQIFIGGEFVGGCTDIFDESLQGRLQQRLQTLGIVLKEEIANPYGFLPNWLQKRKA